MQSPRILILATQASAPLARAVQNHFHALGLLPGRHVLTYCPELESTEIPSQIANSLEQIRVAIPLISPTLVNSNLFSRTLIPLLTDRAKIVSSRGRASLEFFPLVAAETDLGKLPYEVTSLVGVVENSGLSGLAADELHKTLRPFVRKVRNFLIEAKILPSESVWLPPPNANLQLDALATAVEAHVVERESELHALEFSWVDDETRLLNLIADPGEGKTTLVRQFLHRLRRDEFRLAERVFYWSFRNQIVTGPVSSSDQFFTEAGTFFSLTRIGRVNPWKRGEELASAIARSRNLLILDDLQSLQYNQGKRKGELHDLAMLSLLRALRLHNPGLCIVSSTLPLVELEQEASEQHPSGLTSLALSPLSEQKGVEAVGRLSHTGDPFLDRVIAQQSDGHALTLRLISTWYALSKDSLQKKNRDLYRFTVDRQTWLQIDLLVQGLLAGLTPRHRQVLEFLAAIEGDCEWKYLVKLAKTALQDRSVPWDEAPFGWDGKLVTDLEAIGLIERRGSTLTLHPLIRLAILRTKSTGRPQRLRAVRAAVYHHEATTCPSIPDTYATFLNLLKGVRHGSQARVFPDSFDDLFWTRCCQKRVGDRAGQVATAEELATVVGFYDFKQRQPFEELGEERVTQVWNVLRRLLRSVGRFSEVAAHAERNLEWAKGRNNFKGVAVCLVELTEMALIHGQAKLAAELVNKLLAVPGLNSWPVLFFDAIRLSGRVLQLKGRYREALERYQKANDKGKEAPSRLAGSDAWVADTLFDMGNFPAAEKTAWRAIEKKTPTKANQAINYAIVLTKLYLSMAHHGNDWRFLDEAEKHVHESIKLSDESGQMEFVLPAMVVQAGLWRMQQQIDQADSLITTVLFLTKRFKMVHVSIDAQIERGKLLLLRGDHHGARRCGVEIRDLAQEAKYGRCARDLKPLLPSVVVRSDGESTQLL